MSQILQEKQSKLIKSSNYRNIILDYVDVLRTKSYKYEQAMYEFSDIRNRNRVCALGLYNTERYGGAYTMGDTLPYHGAIAKFNDVNQWSFIKIADELERGVSIL